VPGAVSGVGGVASGIQPGLLTTRSGLVKRRGLEGLSRKT